MICAARLQGQDREVLNNGLLRLEFSRQTGLFEVDSLSGGVFRLFDAGPSFQVNGRTLSAREASKVEVRRDNFEDQLGQGERLMVTYSFEGGIRALRYELNLYRGKPWVSLVAYLPKGDYHLGDCSLIGGKIWASTAFGTRIYLNSGNSSYSESGVWQLGMRSWSSANVSVLYEPTLKDAIGLGFYSFRRASASVFLQYRAADEIGVKAAAHYYGYKPQNEE